MAPSSQAGRLLIARPDFVDHDFDMTVTILLEHNEEGALGLVLNRPSTVEVSETFESWSDLVGDNRWIFAGGPVSTESIIALARGSGGDLVHDMTSIDLEAQPALAAGGIDEVRIFAGYAGWAAGQLEGEILNGGWWLVDGTIDDVFCPDPSRLWPSILKRQPGELAWYAHYPTDASRN